MTESTENFPSSGSFQLILMEKIRQAADPSHKLSDLVIDILGIGRDATYRRMRGDTPITFDEAVKLANHFKVSLSEVAGYSEDSALFKRPAFIRTIDDFRAYMHRSLKQLEYIQQHKGHNMYYFAKDIPVFYHYMFPELAGFKMYVWLKSVYGIDKLNNENYDLSMIPADLLDLAQKQWEIYSRINTVEIWNDTTILSLINQIAYYYEAGMLNSREEALRICDCFNDMMKIVYKQALKGQKAHAGNTEVFTSASYKMYFHEILIMDNHILAEYGEQKMIYFVPYAGVNFLSTADPDLTQNMQDYLHHQIQKCSLISDISEKDRNKFFIRIKSRLDQLKERISNTDPFL